MVSRCVTKIPFVFVMVCLFYFSPVAKIHAEEATKGEVVSPAEIEAVIKSLEDPETRQKLIRQLKIMAQAQQADKTESAVKNAATQVLRDISRRVAAVTETVLAFSAHLDEIPNMVSWFKEQLSKPQSRKMWGEVFINIVLTLGWGYIVFYLARLALVRPRRLMSEKEAKSYLYMIFRGLGALVLDLLPVVGFAIAAYVCLSLVSPRENTRLVALAWVNAFIIAHTVIALFKFLLAPQSSNIRFSGLRDENARCLMSWGRRLTFVVVYGFFALQAALLLGLPTASYGVLLRLLGLIVAALIVIMILKNREAVALYLRQPQVSGQIAEGEAEAVTEHEGDDTPKPETEKIAARAQGVCTRVANVWHLLAIFYVILLYGVWVLRVPDGFLFLFRATVLTIVTLLIIRAVLRIIDGTFTKGIHVSDDVKIRFSGLESRVNRYRNVLYKAFKFGIYFLGLIAILQAWGVTTYRWFLSEPGRVLSGTIASVVGIVLVSFVIWEFTNSLIENSLSQKNVNGVDIDASARTRTLLTVARKALAIVLSVVAILMILAELGVNIGPLLAGAGVLGLAVGFGSQKLVQDVITGVFILLEDQIAVGDVVDLEGKGGIVEAVSIRTVRLRDLSGTVHTIPFSAISTVSNRTKDFSYYLMEIGVAYRENVDEVMAVLKDIGAELQGDSEYGPKILEPLEVLGVDAFGDSAVVIKARIKTVPIKQWWVGREFNRRMKNRFDELDIEIPFPHQTVYFGVDKQGKAVPARLKVEPGDKVEKAVFKEEAFSGESTSS